MATLSRDTDNANGKVSDGFEQGKIADRLEIQREAVALSVQTMGAVQSRLKADKENEIAAKLSAQGLTSEQIAASPEYKQVGQDYGIGGKYWTDGVSFTSALSGLLGGNIQGAAAGAAAPYLANLVKQISGGDEPLRIMLHTALGAFLASAQGGDAVAGAAGALTSAGTADLFIKMFYPMVKEGELTEAQKQVIDNLVVIAGSTAGGLASGSLSGVGSGANTAKNEVENNGLSDIAQAQSEGKTLEQKASEYVEAENERYKKANCGGMSAEACSVKMYTERREALKDMVSTGADFVPVVGTIKSAAEAQSALDYLNVAASLIPGERIAAGVLKAAEKALARGDVAEASKLINKASDEMASVTRPSHRQSEIDVGKDLGDGWREQVSFKDGKEVPYGTKGGVRPDWCQGNVCSVEVKNYNITTNQSGLINNVSKQAIQRAENLPAGMRQEVVIDIRGQKVTSIQEDAIIKGIVQKSNGAIKPTDIQFKR